MYFHVITSTSGAGNLTDAQIQSQIDVLNKAYSGQDKLPNNTWYTMGYNSTTESQAKAALRVGNESALNLYSANIGGGLLGWATFPSSYSSAPSKAERTEFYGTWTTSTIPDTCRGKYTGLDPVENFMDYTDDAYMYRFTAGQADRMDNLVITYRRL